MVERKAYSEEFRRMVAKAYYTGSKSLVGLGKEFNVKPSTVYNWVLRYKDELAPQKAIRQEMSTFKSVIHTPPAVKTKKLTAQQMEQRIEELEQQLKNEQMRSTVLDQMIEIAERDLKIVIRKKSGAKQSK